MLTRANESEALAPVYYLMSAHLDDVPSYGTSTHVGALVIHRDGPEQNRMREEANAAATVAGSQHLSAETWGRSCAGVEARTDVGEIQDLSPPAERAPTFLKGCCDDAHARARWRSAVLLSCCLLLLGKGRSEGAVAPIGVSCRPSQSPVHCTLG